MTRTVTPIPFWTLLSPIHSKSFSFLLKIILVISFDEHHSSFLSSKGFTGIEGHFVMRWSCILSYFFSHEGDIFFIEVVGEVVLGWTIDRINMLCKLLVVEGISWDHSWELEPFHVLRISSFDAGQEYFLYECFENWC